MPNLDKKKFSVLLAETDPICRRAVARLLQERCHVTTSTKFYKIVELLRFFSFNTLYVDYRLPAPGAIPLLEAARELAPDTKRVLMSEEHVENLREHVNNRLIHACLNRASTRIDILRAILLPAQ